jgi:hypothetical protein
MLDQVEETRRVVAAKQEAQAIFKFVIDGTMLAAEV